jgi:glycosyltransferase involved in cell wall biosynthesis
MAAIKVPLLLISDSISAGTGLSRITKDIAVRVHEHLSDVYRVATFGYGGPGTSKCPFQQYAVEGMDNWILPTLPQVWDDFAGKEEGIIMFVWDLSRLFWFSQPERCDELRKFPGLHHWLVNKPKIKKWLYCPLDASGPNDKLTFPLVKTLLGFDRLLAYGKFGEGVIRRSIGDEEADQRGLTHLPHGIDFNVFFPMNPTSSRKLFLKKTGAVKLLGETQPIQGNEILIGCVATNQGRKDWALACETIAILAKTKAVRFWIHTDKLEHSWSIPALLLDYGIIDQTVVSLGFLSDGDMAIAYSACDATIGPGLGEGFGYPIFESLYCGTPCIHGNYGGAPEWMHMDGMLPEPIAYRYEGMLYSSKRPVYSSQDFADKILAVIGNGTGSSTELDWEELWPHWETWFLDGIK